MYEHDGIRKRTIELGHATGHRARMPMLEHATGDEPELVLLVGLLGRRFVWEREEVRFAIRIAIELEALARFHVGIGSFLVAPLGLFAIHDRPAQPRHLV